MITDVGIDMDGVLYPFATAFKQYCQRRMGKYRLPEPTHWHFYQDWGMDALQFQEWLVDACETERVFSCFPPSPNDVAAINKLRDNGIKIHILTHRLPEAWEQTVWWLNEYDLVPDSLHFGDNKNIIKSLAQDECALVDDHIPFVEKAFAEGINAYVLRQPWNSGGLVRYVDSVTQFAVKVLKHNEKQKPENTKLPEYDSSKYLNTIRTANGKLEQAQFDWYRAWKNHR